MISTTPYRIVPTCQFVRSTIASLFQFTTASRCNGQSLRPLLRSLLAFAPSCSLFSACSSLFFTNAGGRGIAASQNHFSVDLPLSALFSAVSELLNTFCRVRPLFSMLCELFAQKTPGVGVVTLFFAANCRPKFACLSGLPVQSTLIPTHLCPEPKNAYQ